MTPQERARDIFNKFSSVDWEVANSKTGETYFTSHTVESAKKCAILCVDEIMNIIPRFTDKNEARIIEMMDAVNDISDDDERKFEAQEQADLIAQKLRQSEEYNFLLEVRGELEKI